MGAPSITLRMTACAASVRRWWKKYAHAPQSRAACCEPQQFTKPLPHFTSGNGFVFHLRENGKGGLGTPTPPPKKKVSYLRRRRAAKPANASRESVAVVGSGMVCVEIVMPVVVKLLLNPEFPCQPGALKPML